jgi:lipase
MRGAVAARSVMRLHVHEWGEPSGPPVVCLHGLSGQGGRFNRLAARLGSRRVLAVDLRGHGRSDPAPPWDTATHVQDVLETAAAHGIERCDWIGFSFGGRIAAALAAWAPERVDRLCLLDPALHVPPAECLDRAVVELEELSFGSVDEAIDTELAAGTLLRAPREILEEVIPDELERRADGRLVYRYSRAAAIAAWSEMALPAPPVAAVPTLLLTGESSWLPVDMARYRAALRDELLTEAEVPGGHSVLWDALEETAAATSAYLARS